MTPSPSSSAFGGQANNASARRKGLICAPDEREQNGKRGLMLALSELSNTRSAAT
jgi:hypothetical protein